MASFQPWRRVSCQWRTFLLVQFLVAANSSFSRAHAYSPDVQANAEVAERIRPLFGGPLALYLNDSIGLTAGRQILPPVSNTTRQLQQARAASHQQEQPQQQHVRRRQTTESTNTQRQTQATSLKAFYYFIQALGKSDNSGCRHPQPAFTASCPTGAFIVSQSARTEWRSRLDCVQTSPTQIHCAPKTITEDNQHEIDFDDLNGVTIACYGTYTEEGEDSFDPWANLQVSVQVDPGSYYCDKALEVKTLPHPTVITGGSVYQTVAIQKQCYVDERDNSWVFVEPTCDRASTDESTTTRGPPGMDLFQTTQVDVEYSGDNSEEGEQNPPPKHREEDRADNDGAVAYVTTQATAMIAHCEMEDGCQAEYSCSPNCGGKDSCLVTLPGFITNSTAAFTTFPLLNNYQCLPRDFVMDLQEGDACEFNLMCTSGICIDNMCAAERLEDHEICEEAKDCHSQACGKHPHSNTSSIERSDIPDKTCCPSGGTFGHEGESFCKASQPEGAACHEDAMCQSNICVFNTCRPTLLTDNSECEEGSDCEGGVCGQYHDEGVNVCCPTGESIHLSDGPWCSNRPTGDACENLANSLCKSNICVEGLCQGIEQEAGAVCDNHFDCQNSACALEAPHLAAKHICCPTGDYVFVARPEPKNGVFIGPNSLRVCTGQPEGTPCQGLDQDLDNMCASGNCIDGTCRSQRLPVGADCKKDEDCQNYVCAWSNLEQSDDSKICCPSGDHKHIYVPSEENTDGTLVDVCTGQPKGAACGDHDIHVLCDSGYCVDGFCEEGPMLP